MFASSRVVRAHRGPGHRARGSGSWCSASRTWASTTSAPATCRPSTASSTTARWLRPACGRTARGRHRWRRTPRCRRARGCGPVATAAQAFPADTPIEGSTAARGDRAAPGYATDGRDRPARRTEGHRRRRHGRVERARRPRHRAGRRRAHDRRRGQRRPDLPGGRARSSTDRPPSAAMRDDSSVDTGRGGRRVSSCSDPSAPYGVRADARSVPRRGRCGHRRRPTSSSSIPATPTGPRPTAASPRGAQAEELRRDALRATDGILRDVVDGPAPGHACCS